MRKLAAIALVAISFVGCASTGGAKKVGYVGLSAAGQGLFLLQDAEMGLVCGRDRAPAPPLCVPEDVHRNEISPRLAKAFGVGEKAAAALRALPPEVTAPTPEVMAFVSEIWSLVEEIRGLLPASTQAKALQVQLDQLAAKK